MIRKLVTEGADVNGCDVLKKTPLHFAAIGAHTEACRTLLELGSNPDARALGDKRPLDWAMVDNWGTKQWDKPGTVALLKSYA